MEIRTKDLPGLVGKQVVVETDYATIEGEVLATTSDAIVLRTKAGTSVVELSRMIDIRLADPATKIVRRKIRPATIQLVRQHLLDRHGMQWDLMKLTSPSSALALHELTDHTNLGHQHRADTEEE
jgi:hypothetical protein